MNQTAAFEDARKTVQNIREAAAAGDKEAQELLKLFDGCSPAAVFVDISKYRPK